ncbi:hypothetical protein JTB14_037821 [Gonioctena quinquepunctata]|nr:hypothetical protein JTB14_037821 [Gonioctena quinquepunctata]
MEENSDSEVVDVDQKEIAHSRVIQALKVVSEWAEQNHIDVSEIITLKNIKVKAVATVTDIAHALFPQVINETPMIPAVGAEEPMDLFTMEEIITAAERLRSGKVLRKLKHSE